MMGSSMLLTILMEITDAWRLNDHAILWVIKAKQSKSKVVENG